MSDTEDNRAGDNHYERIGDIPAYELDLYALDALPADEAVVVERALEGATPEDRQKMVAHIAGTREVAASLVAGADLDEAPPQHLRAEILDRIEADRAEEDRMTAPTPIDARRGRRPSVWLAAAAAGVVLLAGGVVLGRLTADAPTEDPPVAAPAEEGMPIMVADLLSADDLSVAQASVAGDGTATVLASRSQDAAMISMFGLPELEQGRAYQLWLIGPGHEPIPSGTMEAGTIDDDAAAELRGISGSTSVGVTEEPAGGSPEPTGEILVALDFE